MNKKFSVVFILMAFLLSVGILLGFSERTAFAMIENDMLKTESKSCYLIEPISGSVIYAKNENEKRPIASMCKIMTLLLTFEEIDNGKINLDSDIVVSDNASSMGGSQVFLESNGIYKANDLIKSIVVASANDACVAIAEYLYGSEDAFVDKMNEKAKELDMKDTNFVNCTGLPKQGQYSSAKDVSKMFSELIRHEEYFVFSNIWMDEINHSEGRKTEISNTNKLIRFYDGCDGGKTGYTSEAGHCLAACAKRNGMRLISVVINSPDSKRRFKEVSSMFNYGFANYCNKLIIDKEKDFSKKINVVGGEKEDVSVAPESSLFLFSKKGKEKIVEFNLISKNDVKAPILKGDVIGEIEVYENSIKIASVNMIALEDVAVASYFDYFIKVANNWSII